MRGDDLSGAVSVRTMHTYATNKKIPTQKYSQFA